MNDKQLTARSKRLSFILRHDPASAGLTLNPAGWVEVTALLAALGWVKADLDRVVSENNKKRFEYSSDGLQIRASQGHSVDVDLGYEPKVPPATLYHGTSQGAVDTILSEGIKKMGRHHVHLSADEATARIVANRRQNPRILHVDAARMVRDGHAFFLSTNGVWLTEYVSPLYIGMDHDG